jgi:glycosyltransferase 2 family protein
VKDKLINALKILVSFGLVAYLVSRVQLEQITTVLQSANAWYLLPAAILYLGAMSSGAFKWYVLLQAQGIRIPFRRVLAFTFTGFFFNNFFPANIGGDVMRGYGLARYTERTADAAVSVVVDRLVGLIAFITSAVIASAVAIFLFGRSDMQRIELAGVIVLLAVAGGFSLLLSHRFRHWLEPMFNWRLLKGLAPLYARLSGALGNYRHSYNSLFLAFCVSMLTLVLTNFTDYFIVLALGGGLPLIYIFVFNPIIAFVLLIPISVGGLGVSQSAYVFFYGLVGIAEPFALTLSLIKQAIIYLTSIPGGLLWWGEKHQRKSTSESAAILPNKSL